MDQPPQLPAILIVDDDPAILMLLRIFMEDIAPTYDILTAADGRRALSYLTERPIQLLITDYMMAGMNGLELTAAVKTASPMTHVIMITAYSSALLEQRAREYKVDTFLTKDAMFSIKAIVRSVLLLPERADD
jgi:CheY-like chemotaxis protein